MRRTLLIAASVAVLFAVTACTAPTGDTTDAASPAVSAAPTASQTPTPSASAATTTPDTAQPPADAVVGTLVRFTSDDAVVDVTITSDNPTTRDFLSMLPLTMTLEEFNGREKIGYPPRELETAGSPGSDPVDGDLIYYAPWGNIGFYYNTEGVTYSDQTINIGTYNATLEELNRLEGTGVTIEVVE